VSRHLTAIAEHDPAGLRDDAEPDSYADATTTAIAALRQRLSQPSALEHPAVCRELRKLEEQLMSQFDQGGRKPGRHRSPA